MIAKSKEATEQRTAGEVREEEPSGSGEKEDIRRDNSRSKHPGGYIEDLLIRPRRITEERIGEERTKAGRREEV